MKQKIEDFLTQAKIKPIDLAVIIDTARNNTKRIASTRKNNLIIDLLSYVQIATGLTGTEFVGYIMNIENKSIDLRPRINGVKNKERMHKLISDLSETAFQLETITNST